MDDMGRASVARQAQSDTPPTHVDPVEAEFEVASELASVRHARGFVADVLQESPFVDDAELVTAELVTNAVLHGAPPIVVRVRVGAVADVVRIEVQDAGRAMPVVGTAVDGAMTGRGLG